MSFARMLGGVSRRVDRVLGITWAPHDATLNRRGRWHERYIRTTSRLAARIDSMLGIVWLPSDATLNWKGRAIERVTRALKTLVSKIDKLASISWAPVDPSLNWRGRLIERALRLYRRVGGLGFRILHTTVNEVCFAAFMLSRRLRRQSGVQSVLQLSIASSKPWMISRVLRRHGIKSEYFALNTDIASGTLNIGCDYQLPYHTPPKRRRLLEMFYLWTVLARYDVIHSHFNTLLSHDGWEFAYLKKLGIGVVFTFRGCDLRSRTLNMRLHPELNCCTECDYPVGSCDTDYQRSRLALARAYGDAFFVTTPDLVDFFDGSSHMPFIQPVLEGLDEIKPAPKATGVFRVVTSSNHHGIDGTRFIVGAVERLRAEGRAIELVVVSGQPFRQAIAIYKSADAFVGKLRLGYYNNANIETMMLGVPNFSYVRDAYRHIAPDCPIIVTTPDTVYDRLRHYLDRPDELRAIGARGPEFVKRHHHADMLAVRLIEQYNRVFQQRRAALA